MAYINGKDLSGVDIANLMYGTAGGGTYAIANGTHTVASANCVLTNKGWTDVAGNSFVVSNGPVIASDFIKLKPKTVLYVYDLKVIDLRPSTGHEDSRIKLNIVGGCIEVAEGRDAKEAIKLRHSADFAKIEDIEYMSVLITNLNSYEIEQKVE